MIAFTAECPHLGCAINLAADGKSFLCPCHTSAFDFEGKPQNQVPPRPMDRLDVELTSGRRPRGPRQVPAVPDPGRGEDPPCLTNLPTGSTTGPGYRGLVTSALDEPIPGGARWRYVFGSALRVGLPDPGVHRPAADDLVQPVVVDGLGERLLHQQRDVDRLVHPRPPPLRLAGDDRPAGLPPAPGPLVAGAYRAPREVNWWFGLALLVLTLGFSHTGYLLPWDQKGYWATKVVTNIMGGRPVVGPYLQKVVVGGTEYGNQTLTRFYGLHVGILPALHRSSAWRPTSPSFRRHGLTPPAGTPSDGRPSTYWPEQSSWTRVAQRRWSSA